MKRHNHAMRRTEPTERGAGKNKPEQHGTEIPHECPGDLRQSDRDCLAQMAAKLAKPEIGPGPAVAHAPCDERAIQTNAGYRSALDRANVDQRRSTPVKQKYQRRETGLPDDRSDSHPPHLVVRLEEPLQQKRSAEQTQPIQREQQLHFRGVVQQQNERKRRAGPSSTSASAIRRPVTACEEPGRAFSGEYAQFHGRRRTPRPRSAGRLKKTITARVNSIKP